MKRRAEELIRALWERRSLEKLEYEELLSLRDADSAALLRSLAKKARESTYRNRVFLRALIEISNVCKNDCLYCGVRASNKNVCRFSLTDEEILSSCAEGYALGLRTFVLQGGEDARFTDKRLTSLITNIKRTCPEAAVTLSLGERSRKSYTALRNAGADRYLLRHETANAAHYASLHPENMRLETRMRCLSDLKELGFQVGAGFMVGSPNQTLSHLAEDLQFIETFRPQMCGIGPFLPQHDTPFAKEPAGDTDLCLYLLSILRILDPALLLPATTALATAHENGTILGLEAGANVIMPNLSPRRAKENYVLYDGKKITGDQNAANLETLKQTLATAGYVPDFSRGDYRKEHHGTL
ncbi:MAG: [Clostridia bacterium]|nr:[FeFe] hydrogenase H-cluster radical SAM maturase HydE [Clostridia bacterium]